MWWSSISAEPLLEALGEALVDHRAVEDVLRRVADRRGRARRSSSRAHELVVDGLVDDRGAERRAALAGRAEAAEQRALDREVEVGVVHDDHRVLAAELEARRSGCGGRRARRSRAPTALEPVKPTLSTRPSSSARSRPAKVLSPSACTSWSTPAGTPPRVEHAARARRRRRREYSAGFQTTALPHRIAGTRYQDGTATGKLPAVMIAATPTGTRKVKSCLSVISRRDRLAVQAPALAEEEVARVDDLLDLAERLRVRLADLARDEAGERLLVVLDDAPDVGDHARRARAPGPSAHSVCAARAPRGRRRRTCRRRRAGSRRRRRRAARGSSRSADRPARRERAEPSTIEAMVLVAVAVDMTATDR